MVRTTVVSPGSVDMRLLLLAPRIRGRSCSAGIAVRGGRARPLIMAPSRRLRQHVGWHVGWLRRARAAARQSGAGEGVPACYDGLHPVSAQVPSLRSTARRETALAAAAIFAAATGAISLRTTGVYYIMISLAFGQMLYFLAVSLSVYGGDDGITLAKRSTLAGLDLLKNNYSFYYLALAVLMAAYLFAHALVAARFGRVLIGTRENPQRMRAIGFEPYPYQLTAYVISGMICALAGVLLANQAEFVSPAYMTWQRSGELLIMVILGGVGTLYGAVLGAIAFLLLEDGLSHLTEHWKMIFGPILILIVLFGRGGIAGAARRIGSRRREAGHG